MNRRKFISALSASIAGIGSFNILKGADRVWVAERKLVQMDPHDYFVKYWQSHHMGFIPSFQDFLKLRAELLKLSTDLSSTGFIINPLPPIKKP